MTIWSGATTFSQSLGTTTNTVTVIALPTTKFNTFPSGIFSYDGLHTWTNNSSFTLYLQSSYSLFVSYPWSGDSIIIRFYFLKGSDSLTWYCNSVMAPFGESGTTYGSGSGSGLIDIAAGDTLQLKSIIEYNGSANAATCLNTSAYLCNFVNFQLLGHA
jgi:hypothetical protein